MAEVVAIVASGISIVQIAAQVADSIISIKSYWDRVKAAPDDIKHLLREMEALSVVLHHICDDLSRNTLPGLVFDDSCIRQSFELCRDGAAELEQLVKDLAETIDGKSSLRKTISAARAVINKSDIKRLKQRLKNAIRLLSLAYQCYTNAMTRLQPDIIVARLLATMALSSSQSTTAPDLVRTTPCETQRVKMSEFKSNDVVMLYYSYWISSPSRLRFLFGSFRYYRQNSRRRGQYYQQFQARYKFPEWFSTRVLDICGYKTLPEWSINVKTYRIVPDNAPIFRAIKNQDVFLVQNLLASREAFVTDRDDFGRTLLHRAAGYRTAEICSLLISEGAGVCVSAFDESTPLECASKRLVIHVPGHTDKTNVFRCLINAGAGDGLANEIDALLGFCGEKDDFKYLQQQTYTFYYDLPLVDRFRVAKSICYRCPNAAELTRIALFQGQLDQETILYSDNYRLTSLHIVTGAFTNHYYWWHCSSKPLVHWYDNTHKYKNIYEFNNPWRVLLRDVVSAGAFLHAINDRKRSILAHVISVTGAHNSFNTVHECFVAISQVLNIWLTDLHEVGIDLVQYGAEEKALLFTGKVDTTVRLWDMFGEPGSFYPVDFSYSFSYGPRPEDWRFWFSEPTDIFAGELWAMLENCTDSCTDEFELPVPGSWSD